MTEGDGPPIKAGKDLKTMAEAISEALGEEMARDERVFIMGEDVGAYGGVYRATLGLLKVFGGERVIDTPLAESGIVGLGVGAAWNGLRPVVEIMFADMMTLAMDQLVNIAAKWRYLSNGQSSIPLVIRTSNGAGLGLGAMHSQCIEAWLANVPGLKMVMPSTIKDAKGLLKSSIRDDDPVVFFEHKALFYAQREKIPDEEYLIPLGEAEVKREGDDVTVVAWGMMVHQALTAAETLAAEGISTEIIDLRTLAPMDTRTILESVRKTGRLVTVEETPTTGGLGGEIAAIVAEEAFDSLDAPIRRVGAPFIPVPEAKGMEALYLPNAERIVSTVRETIR